MKVRRLGLLCLAMACSLAVLSACAGGDEDDEPTATVIPPVPTAVPTTESSPTPDVAETAAITESPIAADVGVEGTPIAVTVILTDYRVSAFQKELVVGQTYTFTIQNNGASTHQFVIELEGAVNAALTSNGATSAIAGIEPGGSATLTWTFTEAGAYRFACHEPGHFEQGMVQTGIMAS